MLDKKLESFWDYLIWVAVLLTAFTGLDLLLNHLFPSGGRLIYILFALCLLILPEIPAIGRAGESLREKMLLIAAMAGAAEILLDLIGKDGERSSWIGWVLPVIILWQAVKLYQEHKEKEEKLRESRELLSRSMASDSKAIILVYNAQMEDLAFEADDRMVLYSLPEDGRFLVLFRKQVGLEDFLHVLSAFRTEVDDDEDAIGLYGQTFYGARPDSLQAFVSDLSGVCRSVPFDIASVSLSGAEPVLQEE